MEHGSLDVDAVVVGAGFGGLRMLHELRSQGLSATVLDAGTDVGGTWYWNRYPGARTDSEAWVYAFAFSRELQDEWDWTERFPPQAETLAYLRHVADRFDMRRDIRLRTRATAATWDESARTWTVRTDQGDAITCRYFVPALGVLSTPYRPDIPGLADFRGDWYQTGTWPHEKVDMTGKRVAVIGTGATAVQMIPIVAHTAAEVVVFQRTPNYVLPARNYMIAEDERQALRANYDEIWAKAREHFFGFPWDTTGRTVDSVTPEEYDKILEMGWEIGGFRYIFETFDDIFVDERSNRRAADFVRNKIRTIVKDPATAELLCPKDHPIAAKRPPLGHFYYETFNRDNVTLVDVSSTPIGRITAAGVVVGDVEYGADVIVFATGFDAVTGSYDRIDIRGRDGVRLTDAWADGPRTHLGIQVDGFPNMFMMGGPQTPFSNIPVAVDVIADWIGRALGSLRERNLATMEAEPAAADQWRDHMTEVVNATVLPQGPRNWFMGTNIPGKPPAPLFYFAGIGAYRRVCDDITARGYPGFVLA